MRSNASTLVPISWWVMGPMASGNWQGSNSNSWQWAKIWIPLKCICDCWSRETLWERDKLANGSLLVIMCTSIIWQEVMASSFPLIEAGTAVLEGHQHSFTSEVYWTSASIILTQWRNLLMLSFDHVGACFEEVTLDRTVSFTRRSGTRAWKVFKVYVDRILYWHILHTAGFYANLNITHQRTSCACRWRLWFSQTNPGADPFYASGRVFMFPDLMTDLCSNDCECLWDWFILMR